MEHHFHTTDGIVDTLVAPQLALDYLDVARDPVQVPPHTRREVVDDANRIAAREQRSSQVRADEPCAAGDENMSAHRTDAS